MYSALCLLLSLTFPCMDLEIKCLTALHKFCITNICVMQKQDTNSCQGPVNKRVLIKLGLFPFTNFVIFRISSDQNFYRVM